MHISDQVLTIEQMDNLKKLGVDTSNASMIYLTYKDTTDNWIFDDKEFGGHFEIDESSEPITTLEIKSNNTVLGSSFSNCSTYTCCKVNPTFTLYDMLSIIPKNINEYKLEITLSEVLFICYKIDKCDEVEVLDNFSVAFSENSTILNDVYYMLCKLAKNGYLNNKK